MRQTRRFARIIDLRSPYANLPSERFWRTGVTDAVGGRPSLYTKKFDIAADDGIATAGSCFAQNIARYLRAYRYRLLDVEPAPIGISDGLAQRFGYRLFSARYGNIYTARQLHQLAAEAAGSFAPQGAIWARDGRSFDALRPSVEPDGLSSADEVAVHRRYHLERVADLLRGTQIFIFTFGLTEAWVHRESGTVFPTAPGTVAGDFDPDIFAFENFAYGDILDDFLAFRRIALKLNPAMRFIVTVSPVPLTATATSDHVLTATIHSKSVLRAVAGQLAKDHADIDYFPSYEVIATPFLGTDYFEANRRSVSSAGIETVMGMFFGQHDSLGRVAGGKRAGKKINPLQGQPDGDGRKADDVVCEDVLLDAFAR